jgi:hypothetical protein
MTGIPAILFELHVASGHCEAADMTNTKPLGADVGALLGAVSFLRVEAGAWMLELHHAPHRTRSPTLSDGWLMSDLNWSTGTCFGSSSSILLGTATPPISSSAHVVFASDLLQHFGAFYASRLPHAAWYIHLEPTRLVKQPTSSIC